MNFAFGNCLAIAVVAATTIVGRADDRPPTDAKPLVEIIATLEESGYGPIVEAEFDDRNWEIEAFEGDQAYELLIDPLGGEILSKHRDKADDRPPAGSMRLSEIVASLMKAEYADIHDISFEGRSWEVEARRQGVKRELRVEPRTGEVISDRSDD